MGLPNVSVIITSGNLDRQAPDTDNVCGLVLSNAGYSSLAHLESAVVYSLSQAEAFGFSAAEDVTNKLLHHEQMKEFFRKNPNGELHILVTQGIDVETMLGDDATPGAIEPFIVAANGRIKQLAIMAAIGALVDFNLFFTDDLIANNLIDKAQAFADRMGNQKRWIDVVYLEAFGFDESPGTAPDLRLKDARNVGVVVGGDRPVADASLKFNGYAAIGTLLGSSTNKQVHESFAWAKDENTITSAANNRFLEIKINTDLTAEDEYTEDEAAQNALHDKGYIFPRQFPLRSGYYWNQSNNCVAVDDDFNNIELVQVIHKAVRIIGTALARHVNETFDVVTGGRLKEITRRTIAGEIKSDLETDASNNISSIGDIIVDPAKKADNTDYPSLLVDPTLRAIVGITPKGKTDQIILEIGFQAPS